jgi:hypothetical protein
LKTVENWGVGSKEVRERNGKGWTKVKYTHNSLNLNNERQDCKISTVRGGGTTRRG